MTTGVPRLGKKVAPRRWSFPCKFCNADVPREGASCGSDECKRKAAAIKAAGKVRSGANPEAWRNNLIYGKGRAR